MQQATDDDQKLVYKQYKLVNDFKDSLLAGNQYSYNTIKNYLSDLRHFIGFLSIHHPDIFESMDVTPQVILDYRHSMQSARTSKITVKRRISAVHRFLEQLPHIRPELGSKDRLTDSPVFNPYQSGSAAASRFNYLNSLLSEYVKDTGSSVEEKNVIRDFLIAAQE